MLGWIFGLSIDDKVEWQLARVPAGASSSFEDEPREKLYGSLKEHPADLNRSGKLQSTLKDALRKFLADQEEKVRSSIRAIGVSAVGTIDRQHHKIVTVGMSHWLPHREPIVDLKSLFSGLFDEKILQPKSGGPSLISVRNETTAKCLAEWQKFSTEDQEREGGFSILYVLFAEGVNASFVSAGRPVVMPLNTEMGHMYPRPHPNDFYFDDNHSGCDRHIYCFEGLASLTRIRRSWGTNTPFKEMSPEVHKQIAFYAAQMCSNGMVTLAPSRILLGGHTFFPGMIKLIRERVNIMNTGKNYKKPYVAYADMRARNFIRMASIPAERAGIAAALGLAHQVVVNPGRELTPTGKPTRPRSVS